MMKSVASSANDIKGGKTTNHVTHFSPRVLSQRSSWLPISIPFPLATFMCHSDFELKFSDPRKFDRQTKRLLKGAFLWWLEKVPELCLSTINSTFEREKNNTTIHITIQPCSNIYRWSWPLQPTGFINDSHTNAENNHVWRAGDSNTSSATPRRWPA